MEMKGRLRKNKFKIFFLCLVVFLLIEPLDTPVIDTFLGIALFILFSFSPYLISPSRKTLALSLTALGVCTFIQLIPPESVGEAARFGGEILGLGIFCIVIAYIFWYTVSSEVVSTDLIYLSLCGYFLIGIGFFLLQQVTGHLAGLFSLLPWATIMLPVLVLLLIAVLAQFHHPRGLKAGNPL